MKSRIFFASLLDSPNQLESPKEILIYAQVFFRPEGPKYCRETALICASARAEGGLAPPKLNLRSPSPDKRQGDPCRKSRGMPPHG
jgi:hypothetical protein